MNSSFKYPVETCTGDLKWRTAEGTKFRVERVDCSVSLLMGTIIDGPSRSNSVPGSCRASWTKSRTDWNGSVTLKVPCRTSPSGNLTRINVNLYLRCWTCSSRIRIALVRSISWRSTWSVLSCCSRFSSSAVRQKKSVGKSIRWAAWLGNNTWTPRSNSGLIGSALINPSRRL